MARISARLIGQALGKNAHEINLLLEKMGFLQKSKYVTKSGSPLWDITDLGMLHGEPSRNTYSFGYVWDEEVIDILTEVFKL